MARRLRAFVSYRRNDAFMQGPSPDRPSFHFIEQLKLALEQLGFGEVFVDTSDIKAGDFFEGRIHKAISNCDLFISLIGREWLRLLDEKIASGDPDILKRELATALTLDKEVVPLLIDGAKMPAGGDLPEVLKPLVAIDGKPVASNAPVAVIVEALRSAVLEVSTVRRLGTGWTATYFVLAFVIWILCAVVPNAVGLAEFGFEPWEGMATSWAGMFIWPIFFLPFITLAIFRPFQILLEAMLNAGSIGDTVKFALPLVFGTVLALGMTLSEISAPQVPWTIHPKLRAECLGPPDPGPSAPSAALQYDDDRRALFSYGTVDEIPAEFRDQFWTKNKCWPNVFFYLTAPARRLLAGADQWASQDGRVKRQEVQQAFLRMIAKDSRAFKGTDAPYSTLFPFYALAFSLMALLLSIAILMAIIYATVSIRRPRDGKVLRIPNEDAFLCLTYAFVTLLIWVPFRMTTNSIKFSYYCVNVSEGCGPIAETFNKDLGFGLALLIGYGALTVGLLWNYRRLLLGFLGTLAVAIVCCCAVAVERYYDTISRLTEYWQFWLAISLLASLLLIALWYQFDPAIVRFKDFQERK